MPFKKIKNKSHKRNIKLFQPPTKGQYNKEKQTSPCKKSTNFTLFQNITIIGCRRTRSIYLDQTVASNRAASRYSSTSNTQNPPASSSAALAAPLICYGKSPT